MNFRVDIQPTPRPTATVPSVPRSTYERVLDNNAVLLDKLADLRAALNGDPAIDFHVPPFTRQQTVILQMLARHPGRVVRPDTLLRAMWGSSLSATQPSRQSLSVQINRIRKVGPPLGIKIEPVRLYGYRLPQEGAAAWQSLSTKGANDHG